MRTLMVVVNIANNHYQGQGNGYETAVTLIVNSASNKAKDNRSSPTMVNICYDDVLFNE